MLFYDPSPYLLAFLVLPPLLPQCSLNLRGAGTNVLFSPHLSTHLSLILSSNEFLHLHHLLEADVSLIKAVNGVCLNMCRRELDTM